MALDLVRNVIKLRLMWWLQIRNALARVQPSKSFVTLQSGLLPEGDSINVYTYEIHSSRSVYVLNNSFDEYLNTNIIVRFVQIVLIITKVRLR